jgi:hypothetical protein
MHQRVPETEAVRSSASRIAFGAYVRLRRHQSSAARICAFARSLTSISSGRVTRGRASQRERPSTGWSDRAGVERWPRGADSRFPHLPRSIISFERQDRHGRTFGQFRAHLDPTVDNWSWCDPHWGIPQRRHSARWTGISPTFTGALYRGTCSRLPRSGLVQRACRQGWFWRASIRAAGGTAPAHRGGSRARPRPPSRSPRTRDHAPGCGIGQPPRTPESQRSECGVIGSGI